MNVFPIDHTSNSIMELYFLTVTLFRTNLLFPSRDGKPITYSCVFMAYSSKEFQFILVVFKVWTSRIWGFLGKKNNIR